jgi:simple sugar transport system permease protein
VPGASKEERSVKAAQKGLEQNGVPTRQLISHNWLWPSLVRTREIGIAVAGFLLFVLFTIFSHGQFLSLRNWTVIATSAAELGIVSVGVALLMIGGDFDLSVGANFGFSGVIMALMIAHGYPGVLALLACLAIGAGIGLVNGLVTIVFSIPSFITTLGTWLLFTGINLIIQGGETISILKYSNVLHILGGSLYGDFTWGAVWWLFTALIIGILLHRTAFGNWVFAIGGNKMAAREAGVPVTYARIMNFVICGITASLAGAITLGNLQSMQVGYGSTYQLESIAASVVGGCALTGGVGSILGAVIGTVILSMLDSGLLLSGASPYWYEALVGVIVILAVAMHTKIGHFGRGREEV